LFSNLTAKIWHFRMARWKTFRYLFRCCLFEYTKKSLWVPVFWPSQDEGCFLLYQRTGRFYSWWFCSIPTSSSLRLIAHTLLHRCLTTGSFFWLTSSFWLIHIFDTIHKWRVSVFFPFFTSCFSSNEAATSTKYSTIKSHLTVNKWGRGFNEFIIFPEGGQKQIPFLFERVKKIFDHIERRLFRCSGVSLFFLFFETHHLGAGSDFVCWEWELVAFVFLFSYLSCCYLGCSLVFYNYGHTLRTCHMDERKGRRFLFIFPLWLAISVLAGGRWDGWMVLGLW